MFFKYKAEIYKPKSSQRYNSAPQPPLGEMSAQLTEGFISEKRIPLERNPTPCATGAYLLSVLNG